ncbi:MAG: HAMP domain-containing sensor histidine kinase [Campylobacterota bacterium]|nr:HAMP domain-containing sensor histidine kinase [Campylobacterota bacterium]
MAIKLSEKESFFKSFGLFFIVIELFLFFIFYYHYKIEEEHLSEALFLEMKNYSFDFEDERFDTDILTDNDERLYEFMHDTQSVYILVPLLGSAEDTLKIFYPLHAYEMLLLKIRELLYWQFFALTFIAFLMALLFSYYSLNPLRNSLRLLEEFIKDIIHDLNTPISAILINLKMMEKNDEVESIEYNTKSIAMLHKNLDSYLREIPLVKEPLVLKAIVEEQIAFFKPLYDYLEWQIDLDDTIIMSDRNALSRIVYNLIGNACKYNTNQGVINIKITDNKFMISNNSYGVKNPSKVFHRFYKEGERGLGIGLHIVEKLSSQLDIDKSFVVENNQVKVALIF